MGKKRGVKQGDPLSSTLFNLVIDPLLRELETQGLGFSVHKDRTSTLAYADDIVAMADTPEDLQAQVNHMTTYLKSFGLRLSVPKYTVLHIRRVRKTWTMPEYDILSDADTLRNLGVNDNFQYLGGYLQRFKGY